MKLRLPLPLRRFKAEFLDASGTRHTLTVEGNLTQDKIRRVLDYAELMSRVPAESLPGQENSYTMISRLEQCVYQAFGDEPFTSVAAAQAYTNRFGESIRHATVATYLARLAERGVLAREGRPNERRYRLTKPTRELNSLPEP